MKKTLLLLIALFSLFSYTAKAQLPGGSKLFIDVSSNNWFVDNAHVGLWIWRDGLDDQWVEVINKAPGETDIYEITLPTGSITGMNMVRRVDDQFIFNGLNDGSVDYNHNESGNIVPNFSTNNKLIINGWTGMTGSWSTYSLTETADNLSSYTAGNLINIPAITLSDAVTTGNLSSLKTALGSNGAITNLTFNGAIPTNWGEDYFSACSANPTLTINTGITLADEGDINLPRKITMGAAQSISYTRNAYRDGGWETIILPFAVTSTLPVGFSFEKCTASSNGVLTFETVTALDANTPYLMKWDGAVNSKTDVTFTGTVDAQTTTAISVGNIKEIWSSQVIQPTADSPYYILNSTGTSFVRVTNKAVTLKPFRACIYNTAPANAPAQFGVTHGEENGTTGINIGRAASMRIYGANNSIVIEGTTAQEITLHTAQGILIRKAKIEKGENKIEGLTKGLYIVANQKVIVK